MFISQVAEPASTLTPLCEKADVPFQPDPGVPPQVLELATALLKSFLSPSIVKSILSTGQAGDVFKFLDMDTKLLELESGMTQNESVTWAVRS
ncbi:hypothetical protein N9H30_00520, partial [bacterium]|nr:hypothetical protein [bacterium]